MDGCTLRSLPELDLYSGEKNEIDLDFSCCAFLQFQFVSYFEQIALLFFFK